MKNLSSRIILLVNEARQRVATLANTAMVYTYFEIGKMIIEELQAGNRRAAYGKSLLKEISKELSQKLGAGFSVQNLERMRSFYLIYSNSSEVMRNSKNLSKISSSPMRISTIPKTKQEGFIFNLSWTHYLILIGIENSHERKFYEIETLKNKWTVKQLQRQFNSGLFERLLLSRDKKKVKQLSKTGLVIERPQDIIKDPLVLEFLGLKEKPVYSETDLETAIINEIEQFMLELGKGFFFGGRQVRFSFDEEHYRVDLVFYNRILKCFVLVDLKIGKLTHQDIGQMQMYVNYYDRNEKSENENATVGIILCKDKNNALVEITLPEKNKQIFASKYQTVLPSKLAFKKLLQNHA
jgi:predicted nuclease of restriction endonuclease-like (RecB) superfamily